MSRNRILVGALTGLAAAAAAGFRGVMINVGSALDAYVTKPGRSTAQFTDARYPKRARVSVAQHKRASLKTRNRARHRAACRG